MELRTQIDLTGESEYYPGKTGLILRPNSEECGPNSCRIPKRMFEAIALKYIRIFMLCQVRKSGLSVKNDRLFAVLCPVMSRAPQGLAPFLRPFPAESTDDLTFFRGGVIFFPKTFGRIDF